MPTAPEPGATVVAEAPAKLNLGLAVLGKRPDGYHDIRTLFTALDLKDTLRFRIGPPGIRIRIEGPEGEGIPDDGRNLVHAALRRAAAARGIEPGVDVRLEKRIPAGAGLGGGSSNAAAALLAADRLWGALPDGDRARRSHALELGSDVPFFLRGGLCRGEGRGERLTPLDGVPSWVWVLAIPRFGVSTAKAYSMAHTGLTESVQKLRILEKCVESGDLVGCVEHLVNDLEAAAFSLEPRLAGIRSGLIASGAPFVAMTGSGSGLFSAAGTPRTRAGALPRGAGVGERGGGEERAQGETWPEAARALLHDVRMVECRSIATGARILEGGRGSAA
jgi:4-diphosphocytidyl-2-C-methyl-D-erythritol kinase